MTSASWAVEMADFPEGKEIETGSLEWAALTFKVGQILEVDVEKSSHQTLVPGWAAFFISATATESDGSHLLTVRFIGAEDEDVKKELASKFIRGGKIHLCLSRPCVETRPLDALHVTKVRVWSWPSFKGTDYLNRGIDRTVKRWLSEGAGRPTGETPPPASSVMKRPSRNDSKKKGSGPPKAADGKPVGSGISAEMKERLRAKLGDIRSKVQHTGGDQGEEEMDEEEDVPVVGSSSSDYSDSAPTAASHPPPMTTGTAIVPATGAPAIAEASHKKRKDRVVEVTKGSTTRSLSSQLIARAVATTEKRKAAKRKKKKKKSKSNELVSLLGKILTGKKDSKEKKAKKKKKKKKRKVLKDGVIVSCSSSSSEESSVLEPSSESDQDLEAPMRRKSRDHPGSVLSMLTEHVRDVMDQSALTDVPTDLHQVTTGIKVASYFALHVTPHFPGYQRELREMFTLAATLDQLRAGDVARVGDSLAARFMALHQSMLDQSWTTARHMELHNMDDPSSATASIVLASRKHSRLVEKVQGKGTYGWNVWGGRGKRKGKGDWTAPGDHKGEKGKGKKGKKGNPKGPGWDKKVQDWEKSKEDPDK